MNKWINDSECNQCMKCNKYFHLFKRKHHCRKCGNIFCHNCLEDVVYYGLKTKICITCKKNKTYYEYLLGQLNKKDHSINYLESLIKKKNKIRTISKTVSTQTDFCCELNSETHIENNQIDKNIENKIENNETHIENNQIDKNIENNQNNVNENKNDFNILDYLKTLKNN